MNIVNIHSKEAPQPKEISGLFRRMEASLRSAEADFEKSVRLAKTLAPILNDQSSNDRHLSTIASDAPIQEKIIAIVMLGFPKNRALLPVLQSILHEGSNAMRMAAAIAIAKMRDHENQATLSDVVQNAYRQETSPEVKRTLKQVALSLMA